MTNSVTQEWTHELPLMQQAVLLAIMRGPDNLPKDHISKNMCRWFRRCILKFAFTGEIITNPVNPTGGTYTGPSYEAVDQSKWQEGMNNIVTRYLRSVDEIPHHFHMHLVHAAEVLGYKHPDPVIRAWWLYTYMRFAEALHMSIESPLRLWV